jgi:hypothetical protein
VLCCAVLCCLLQSAGRRITLRTDSVHISRPPAALTHPHKQLQLLAAQLAPSAPAAAAACLAAAGEGPSLGGWKRRSSSSSSGGGVGNTAGPDAATTSSSSGSSGVCCWMSASYSYDWPLEVGLPGAVEAPDQVGRLCGTWQERSLGVHPFWVCCVGACICLFRMVCCAAPVVPLL